MLLASAAMLAGCSTIMMPLSGWTSSQNAPPPDDLVTGSIRKAAETPDGDGEVIRRTVETAKLPGAPTALAWTNPTSGNSGTISDIVEARAKNGAPCRDFATTLTTVEGVALYRGRACQGYTGPWDLVEFTRADAKPAG